MRRAAQGIGEFSPEQPLNGYYNDLSSIARSHTGHAQAEARLVAITSVRATANPVSIAQLGLAAWQLRGEAGWLDVARSAAEWLIGAMETDGRLEYLFPMTHTYRLDPPWTSAMAQGQAASLLVRVAMSLGDERYAGAAVRAVQTLFHSSPIVVTTAEGPVLQEYPTDPPADVLNGWIFALWGLYDVSVAPGLVPAADCEKAATAFAAGAGALCGRLHKYRTWPHWSRYDLYPHPVVHVASPFYHRLHAAQLAALNRITPHAVLAATSAEWGRSADSLPLEALAILRKTTFRIIRPRRLHEPSASR